jgi:hypothetical protein
MDIVLPPGIWVGGGFYDGSSGFEKRIQEPLAGSGVNQTEVVFPCLPGLESAQSSEVPMKRAAVVALLLTLAVVSSACGPAVDLTKDVRVEEVSTGWVDAGVVDGHNKVVPLVSFTLKNASDRKLRALQVNAVFRRVNETEGWGDGFRTVAGSDGLAPGAASQTLTIAAQLGYTGLEPADLLLRNSQFVDAKVDVFAKYGSNGWARLGEYPVARQLVAREP